MTYEYNLLANNIGQMQINLTSINHHSYMPQNTPQYSNNSKRIEQTKRPARPSAALFIDVLILLTAQTILNRIPLSPSCYFPL